MNTSQNNNFDELLRQMRDALEDIAFSAKTGLNEIVKIVKDRFFAISPEEMMEMVKMAWSYEEQYCEVFTLSDAISWIKSHFDPQKHASACAFKMSQGMSTTIHLLYLDKDSNPLLSGSDPHKMVHCHNIDTSLSNQFGDKDLIVFK